MAGFVTEDLPMTFEQLNLLLPQFGLINARLISSTALNNVLYVASDTHEWWQVRSGLWIRIIAANPDNDVPGLRTLDGAVGSGAAGTHTHAATSTGVAEVDVAVEVEVVGTGIAPISINNYFAEEKAIFTERVSVSQTITSGAGVSLTGVVTFINAATTPRELNLDLRRSGVSIQTITITILGSPTSAYGVQTRVIEHFDENPGAGTYTYTLHSSTDVIANGTITLLSSAIVAREVGLV